MHCTDLSGWLQVHLPFSKQSAIFTEHRNEKRGGAQFGKRNNLSTDSKVVPYVLREVTSIGQQCYFLAYAMLMAHVGVILNP